MFTRRNTQISASLVVLMIGIALWAGQPTAKGDGVTGKTQSATGCSCHGSTPNAAVSVALSGPQMVAPGSTNTYTLAVAGGPAGTTGGFDLMASGGTLVAGAGSKIMNGELVHVDNTRRSWTFEWTAPAIAGTHSLYAVGMSSNGSNSSGDQWDFAGGALNTAFAIEVNPLVEVAPIVAGVTLGPAFPNPTAASTSVQFTLPSEGPVGLDVINVSGRRIATLLEATLPEGNHLATWNGRMSEGGTAPMGLYFVRLRAAGVEKTTRVVVRP